VSAPYRWSAERQPRRYARPLTDLPDPPWFKTGHRSAPVTAPPPRRRNRVGETRPPPDLGHHGSHEPPAPRPQSASLDPAYEARLSTAREQVQAAHNELDTSPQTLHGLLTQARDRTAAQEAAILLQAPQMTPERAGERLARTRPAPLTASDLVCGTAPGELTDLILTAKAKLRLDEEQQNDETAAGLA
jgi:hypothetical protein